MSGKRWLQVGLLLGVTSAAHGQQFIEDIRISRVGNEATIIIDLACPMRFQSDMPTSGGILLEIRVVPLDECRQLGIGSGFASERTRPVGGQLAHLVEVEYESLGLGDTIVMLQFDRAVRYEVAQRGGLRSLQLTVQLDEPAPASHDSANVPAAAPPLPAVAPPPEEGREPGRAPLRMHVREPETAADYVVNLQSTRDPSEIAVVRGIEITSDRLLYVSQTEVGGEIWYRLRLGFFGSESEARSALAQLAEQFPRAWIGRAEPREVSTASEFELERGEFYVESADTPDESLAVAVEAEPGGESLPAERIDALMAEARDAIVARDFDTAIRNYTRVLQQPGAHRAEAREYLGLAREKNGQLAHARAEYQAYLKEFDSEADRRRVTQRLNGLVAIAAAPRAPLRSEQGRDADRWDFGSGVSQYYRRHVNQFDEDQQEIVTFSALVSDIDVSMRRSGDAIDLVGRVALSHFYDLMDNPRSRSTSAADPTRISYAYLDVDSAQGAWTLRSGRQSLHNWGVLGRFDGLHFTYDWTDDRRVHYQMGYPVESTRHSVRTDREFQGVAIEFDDLVGRWDIGAYVNQQSIESIDDRQAVGIEARYTDDRRSLTGMLDYDTLYSELNTALVLGTWRLRNQLTLSALYDSRKSPFLTTRNSLIGQPISTIDEMLLVWTAEEIEQIALDRTAQSVTTTLGISKPVGERFQINADVTRTEIDATVASAGVAATPSTGQQTYVSTTLVGSGLFGTGDVTILNLRRGTADTYALSQLTWDARFPIGRKLRLNPRIRYAVWESLQGGGTRDTIGASFRLLLNLRNHYRLEFELGTDEVERVNSSSTQVSTGQFFNLGYRASF